MAEEEAGLANVFLKMYPAGAELPALGDEEVERLVKAAEEKLWGKDEAGEAREESEEFQVCEKSLWTPLAASRRITPPPAGWQSRDVSTI
jgi:hypothetical protein